MENIKFYLKYLHEKLSSYSENTPREYYHYLVLTNYIFILALFAHFALLITFSLLGIIPLALVNIASCIIFLYCIAANLRANIILSNSLAAFELITHAVICVYALGWNSGFQYYILGLVVAFFDAPWKSNTLKIFLAALVTSIYIALNYYSQSHAPARNLEPLLLNIFNLVNLLIFIFVISLAIFASDKAVVKAESKLASAIEKIKLSQEETEKKNTELAKKNQELADKNKELTESYKRSSLIFSALSEALPGTVLDEKYQLEKKIGSGGFGAVYQALHVATKRPVAVKIFQPMSGHATVEGLERFQLEAILACRINHPNAVEVLDSGVSSTGIAYIVMELLKGHSLSDEIREKVKLTTNRCAEILIPICDVLAKAHANNIIHRDIKPDNIFLHNKEGFEVIKVVDFGIAKLQAKSESLDIHTITGTGELLGTPTYMSPERLLNKDFDGKADSYSLGVMLYQMLCGQVPFRGNDVWSTIRMQLNDEPQSMQKLNPKVSPEIEAVVLKAMKKDPNERITIKQLAEEFSIASGIELSSSESGSLRIASAFDQDLTEVSSEDETVRKITVSEDTIDDTVGRNTRPIKGKTPRR